MGWVTDWSRMSLGQGLGYRWFTQSCIWISDESRDVLQMDHRWVSVESQVGHRWVTHWLRFRIQHFSPSIFQNISKILVLKILKHFLLNFFKFSQQFVQRRSVFYNVLKTFCSNRLKFFNISEIFFRILPLY